MARRNLVDIDRRILKAVHKIGSEEGIKGVTSKKVAALVGISHFTCFEHFETRQGMLDAAALYIEKQYFDILSNLIDSHNDIYDVWDSLLDTAIAWPDKSMYYLNYSREFSWEITLDNERAKHILNYAKLVFSNSSVTTDLEYLLLWDHVLYMIFYYTEKIIKGLIPNTPEVKEWIKGIVFKGVNLQKEPKETK